MMHLHPSDYDAVLLQGSSKHWEQGTDPAEVDALVRPSRPTNRRPSGARQRSSCVHVRRATVAAVVRVLVVEDYGPLARSLAQGLSEAGYAVDSTGDGEEALWYLRNHAFDVVILDLMLPKVDGLTVLRRMRSDGNAAHVLILTARDDVSDRVAGLDAGADDYLVKPFAFDELVARVRALARRSYGDKSNVIELDDVHIDCAARRVTRAGEPVELSGREFAVLEYLARRRGQVVSRAEIWEHVYDFASEPGSNVVDVYVSRLRKKIDGGRDRPLLRTRRGQGYVLDGAE